MANELDELMDMDPLTLTSKNIDDIIAYHRRNIASIGDGTKKAKKPKGETISLEGIISVADISTIKSPAKTFKRRF